MRFSLARSLPHSLQPGGVETVPGARAPLTNYNQNLHHQLRLCSLEALEHYQGMGKKMGVNPAKALQAAAKELMPYTGK